MLEELLPDRQRPLLKTLPYTAVIAAVVLGLFLWMLRYRRSGARSSRRQSPEGGAAGGYDVARVKFATFVICALLVASRAS